MRTDCSNVYIFSFNAGADAGLAAVAAYSEREAFQILRNSGRYNATPDAYSLIQCRDLGLSTTIKTELLLEVYTNALGAYDAFIKAINKYKGDKGDRGEKGAKGDKGERGEKGEKGDPADVGVLYWGNIIGNLTEQTDLINALNILRSDIESAYTALLAEKQDTIADLADIRTGAGKGATAYQLPIGGIPASDLAYGVIPDVSQFITNTVDDLLNYYAKSETYSSDDVDTLIANQAAVIEILQSAVQSMSSNEAVVAWDGDSTPVVENIPAGVTVQYGGQSYTGTLVPSASTVGKTYYVGEAGSDAKHRYISVTSGNDYAWFDFGTTEVDLSEYQRKDDDIWLTEEEFNEIAVKDPTKTYNIYEDVITI